MKRLLYVCVIGILSTMGYAGNDAFPQETYPNRPITMVVWSPGGMGEFVTRAVCNGAEKELGQPIVIELKPGAGGRVAINNVVKSNADGYTMGYYTTGNLNIQPHMYKLPYNVFTDVTDIAAVVQYTFALCVRAEAPWNSFEELTAYAKKNPGKLKYSTPGVGSTVHIGMERIAMKEGVKITMIPFKSAGEAVTACLGGSTDITFQGPVDIIPQLKAGKLKMLLAASGKRWPEAPNVPDILEKGYNFTVKAYLTFFGPKDLPEPIRKKLENAFKKGMEAAAFSKMLKEFGVEPSFMGGKEYTAYWKSTYDDMGKVIKALGLVEK